MNASPVTLRAVIWHGLVGGLIFTAYVYVLHRIVQKRRTAKQTP